MNKLDLNYVVHFHDITGKPDELFETEAKTGFELLEELDVKYPGFKDLLITNDGKARAQNAMILSRKNIRAHVVHDFSCLLENGDFITFL